jgi:glycine cleavage system aminomethyltransferase T
MASIAGFAVGDAIGGPKVGIVASMMPSPLIGAVIAQALVDSEKDTGVKHERRRIVQEERRLKEDRARLDALSARGDLDEQEQRRVRRDLDRLKADEKRLKEDRAQLVEDAAALATTPE